MEEVGERIPCAIEKAGMPDELPKVCMMLFVVF